MYADFESLLVKHPEGEEGVVNVHEPSGWCIKSVFVHRKVSNPIAIYRGKDCIEKFCQHIAHEAKRLYKSFPELSIKLLTKEQCRAHSRAKTCHICLNKFKPDDRKVRDLCHYTGEHRGVAHPKCNLEYKIPSHIIMIFHNLSEYDSHLFIRELSKHAGRMGVIAKNKEDYISFSVKVEVGTRIDKYRMEVPVEMDLRFIDSFRFMSSSLDSLVNNLNRGGHKLKGFNNYTQKQMSLPLRKRVYPYEYMDSWDKFFEVKLPRIEDFYSKLNMSRISNDDEHAKKVWEEFGLKNLGEYHDLYLRTDVILLSNIFEKFRGVCPENYGLDPTHFDTAPELAWQVCPKKTGITPDLITNPDMLLISREE